MLSVIIGPAGILLTPSRLLPGARNADTCSHDCAQRCRCSLRLRFSGGCRTKARLRHSPCRATCPRSLPTQHRTATFRAPSPLRGSTTRLLPRKVRDTVGTLTFFLSTPPPALFQRAAKCFECQQNASLRCDQASLTTFQSSSRSLLSHRVGQVGQEPVQIKRLSEEVQHFRGPILYPVRQPSRRNTAPGVRQLRDLVREKKDCRRCACCYISNAKVEAEPPHITQVLPELLESAREGLHGTSRSRRVRGCSSFRSNFDGHELCSPLRLERAELLAQRCLCQVLHGERQLGEKCPSKEKAQAFGRR